MAKSRLRSELTRIATELESLEARLMRRLDGRSPAKRTQFLP
jgi:hypothetical protein